MINVETNINEIFIQYDRNFKLKESVVSDFTQFALEDIGGNLVSQRSFDGSSIAPLSPSTIARKGHSTVFREKNILIHSVQMKMNSDNSGEVFLDNSERRADIGAILFYGSSKNNLPARKFFGVSNRVENKIDKYLTEKSITDLFE